MLVASSSVLSSKDKSLSSEGKSQGMASLKRVIPAPIKRITEKKIQEYAVKFFREIRGSGVVRIDFLLTEDEKKIYFNEVNPIPGSLAFYLWKEAEISFQKLLDQLINLAIEKNKEKKKLNLTFKSNILENYGGS